VIKYRFQIPATIFKHYLNTWVFKYLTTLVTVDENLMWNQLANVISLRLMLWLISNCIHI